MPEEIEIPTEHLHEHLQEAVEHEGGSLNTMIALSAAILAVLAAICGLMAGHHESEALIDQIKASDSWSFYQAKGIKASILDAKLEARKPSAQDKEKVAQYKKDQEEIKAKAEEEEASSATHMVHHVILAKAVTLFQVAIALAAMAVMTKKKLLWYTGMLLAVAGTYFFVMGLI